MSLTAAQIAADTYLDSLLDKWDQLRNNKDVSPLVKRDVLGLIEGQLRRTYGNKIADDFHNQVFLKGGAEKVGVDLLDKDKLREKFGIVTDGPNATKRLDGDTNATTDSAKDDPDQRAADAGDAGQAEGLFTAEPTYQEGRMWLPADARLPKMSAADKAALEGRDKDLSKYNNDPHVGFRVTENSEHKPWHPTDANVLNGRANISTLGDTWKAADLAPAINAVAALTKAFQDGKAQHTRKQYARVAPVLEQLSKALQGADVRQQIHDVGTLANNAFQHLRGENLEIRRTLVELATKALAANNDAASETDPQLQAGKPDHQDDPANVVFGDGVLQQLLPTVSAPNVSGVGQAREKIEAVTAAIPTVPLIAKVTVDAGNQKEQKKRGNDQTVPVGTPAIAGPTPGAPPGSQTPGSQTPGKNDALQELLKSLGNTGANAANQAAQIPQQAAQQAGQAAQPLANAAQQAADKPGASDDLQKLLNSWKHDSDAANAADARGAATPAQLSAADADRSAATETPLQHPASAATPAALGAPGTDARPHQLDAHGKPVDKNGDGKVDRDATPLSKKTVKPFDLRLTGVGPEHEQQQLVRGVPDPRIGEMMLNLAGATEAHPMSVLDAAKASGLDLTSLGDPMDASLAKIGDAVVGAATSGIYLGDGLVLTATGVVEAIDDVLAGDGFVSEIPLPDLPEDADSIVAHADHLPPAPDAPVVPDTTGPSGAVPADAAGHTQAPPDGTPPGPGDPPPVAPAGPPPAAAPATPAVEPAASVTDSLPSGTGSDEPRLPTAQPFSGHAVG